MKAGIKQKAKSIKRKAQSIKRKAKSVKLKALLTIMIAFAAVQVSAQVISLDSVLAIINRRSPMLQEYDSKVQALNTYTEGAKSWMAPMVGVGPYWYPYPGETIMSESEKGMFMVNIEQDIPNPAKLKARQNYFASKAKVEEQGRAVQYNALRSEAKTFYYAWLVAEKKQKVLKENEQI